VLGGDKKLYYDNLGTTTVRLPYVRLPVTVSLAFMFFGIRHRISRHFVKLNRQKLKLNRPSTVFCGCELTRDGALPDQRKVVAILNMPLSSDRQGMMWLLGMACYLTKFCPNFSSITAPIRSLLVKDNKFCWHPDVHGAAFDALKSLLVSAPVLAYFDTAKKTWVQYDASQAMLMQDGHPVEYASRAMMVTEQNYAKIENELLAVIFGMERFHTWGGSAFCHTHRHGLHRRSQQIDCPCHQ